MMITKIESMLDKEITSIKSSSDIWKDEISST